MFFRFNFKFKWLTFSAGNSLGWICVCFCSWGKLSLGGRVVLFLLSSFLFILWNSLDEFFTNSILTSNWPTFLFVFLLFLWIFFWAAKSAVETAFFQLLPFLWLMHCACKFDAALWAEAEAVGKTHFSLHCSLLLENSNGDAGGGMQSSRNWLCFCGRWQWHCGCGNFGGADDGKMRRGGNVRSSGKMWASSKWWMENVWKIVKAKQCGIAGGWGARRLRGKSCKRNCEILVEIIIN